MTDDEIRKLARELWHDEGQIEIDDNAIISRNDEVPGAYVAAWLWVDFLEADGCECCSRGDRTLHSCPNADCGKLLCQDCLGIHDCGADEPGNPPSMEETCIHCGQDHEGKRCLILAADFGHEDVDYDVSG